MKKYIYIIFSSLLSILVSLSSCTPDELELGSVVSKDQLKYLITQDENDPNMVILESLTPGLTPQWITPLGRSTRVKDTVKLAFPGEYTFAFGVQSDGGYIQADEEVVSVTTTNFNYIKDPLWELLSGGVGNSKTWYLDLDADGLSRHFAGPLYFYGTDNGWLGNCYGGEDADCWNWNPDYSGNTWLMDAVDFGSMTFDLKGNANVNVEHLSLNGDEVGTYYLDADAKVLQMYDARPLHDAGRDGHVVNWGDLKILSLTEDYMQLAALRDEALSGEGPCLLVYNYISKDYYDNWVPEDVPDPEPELPSNWETDVSSLTNYTIKWKLSPETPFNWANLDGSLMNAWNALSDYPDWTGMTPDVPATYADFSMTMNSQDMTVEMVLPDGSESSGTYTLDEKGIYTFDGVTPAFNICSWVNLNTTAENQWRILSIEKDPSGVISGMWVGALSTEKPEYACWKLIPQFGNVEVDELTRVTEILTSSTWKLDSGRSYDKATSWGAEQGPVIFSDYATWSWNPMPGEQYAAGEVDIDYGSMTFNADGTVTVQQRRRIYNYTDSESGETLERHGAPVIGDATSPDDVLVTDDVQELSGTWSVDVENGKLSMSVGVVHPWTCDYYVLNWGDIDIYRIENGALLLQVMRDADRSGESAMPLTYIFVPEN